jgi:outer membrane protein assembly factor BamB
MRRLLFTLGIGLTSLAASADDWPQFRGNGTGITNEKNLPTEWTGEKNVLWKAKATGRGWASPIVTGDKVIIVSAGSEKDNNPRPMGGGGGGGFRPGGGGGGGGFRPGGGAPPDVVYKWTITCLDLKTGKELWKETAREDKPKIATHGSNTYASETPVTDGERVYVYFGMHGLYCYDLNGKQLWKKDLGSYPTSMGWGTSSSPVLEGDKLFLQIDNDEKSFLVALDKKTGEEAWKKDRTERTVWSSPIVWKNKERRELVTAGQKMRSYDPATGKVLRELSLGGGRCSATPVADEERLYFGLGGMGGGMGGKGGFGPPGGGKGGFGGGGGGSLYAVKAGASGDITPKNGESASAGVAWSQPKAGAAMASPLVYQGYVYVLEQNSGQISCYDAKTGKAEYQKERIEGARAFWASPWAYDGKIFCLDDAGNTFVLKAGPKLEVLGKNSISDQFWASPAASGGTLLLRGVSNVYAIKQ